MSADVASIPESESAPHGGGSASRDDVGCGRTVLDMTTTVRRSADRPLPTRPFRLVDLLAAIASGLAAAGRVFGAPVSPALLRRRSPPPATSPDRRST